MHVISMQITRLRHVNAYEFGLNQQVRGDFQKDPRKGLHLLCKLHFKNISICSSCMLFVIFA